MVNCIHLRSIFPKHLEFQWARRDIACPVIDTTFGSIETVIGEKLVGSTDRCTLRDLSNNQKKRASASNAFILKINSTFTELLARLDQVKNTKLRSRTTNLSKKAANYFSQYQKAELRLPTDVLTCKKSPTCKKILYASSLKKIANLTEKFSDLVTQIAVIMSNKKVGLNKTASTFKRAATAEIKVITKQTKLFPKNKIACK